MVETIAEAFEVTFKKLEEKRESQEVHIYAKLWTSSLSGFWTNIHG